MATQVRRNEAAGRYEIEVDGELAGFAEFHPDDLADPAAGGLVLAFPHTVIEERFGGRGLASQLIKAALDDVRERGAKIVPECSFVARFVEKNPEYADLVA